MKHVAVQLITSTSIALGSITTHAVEHEPFFESEFIQHVDAVKVGTITIGIDGATIHDMLWIIATINRSTRSLNNLDALEDQPLTADEPVALAQSLDLVKRTFLEQTSPVMQQLFVKILAHHLIEEWSHKAQRSDSLLTQWSNTSKEEFEQSFLAISSTQELATFMEDLKHFLSKIIASCPRAWKEFHDNQEYYASLASKKYHALATS